MLPVILWSMMNKLTQKKMFRPADAVLIGVLVIVCLLFYFFRPQSAADLQVVIEKDGSVVAVYSLASVDEPTIVPVPDTALQVEIDTDGAAVVYSDCPDQTCVRTGVLDSNGEAAVCLPNHVVVRLEGSGSPAVDGVTG